MAIVQHILEYSDARVSGGIIHRVKIVGTTSKHGYRYPPDVLAAAAKLYEDVPSYVLHPSNREKKQNTRNLDEHIGSLKNITADANGLWGDLHLKQSHPLAGMILESDGKRFGLSHNARCTMNEERTEVTEIVSVNSVDLVDNPATTNNLFEEEEMDLAELVEANKALDTRLTELDGKLAAVLEAVTKPPEKERIRVLEEAGAEMYGEGETAPIGNTHDDFLGVLHGFPVTNAKGA